MKYLWILALLGLSHCGYNWGHSTRDLPGGHKTVFVEIFENISSEPGVEHMFTQALTRELARSGFAIVTSKDTAELIIKGNIIALDVAGGGATKGLVANDFQNNVSSQFDAFFFTLQNIGITTNIKVYRSRDEQLIWQTAVKGQDVALGSLLRRQGVRSSNVLYNQSRKKQTIKLIAQRMMNEAFDRMTEKF